MCVAETLTGVLIEKGSFDDVCVFVSGSFVGRLDWHVPKVDGFVYSETRMRQFPMSKDKEVIEGVV